jgi:hypothetical protein
MLLSRSSNHLFVVLRLSYNFVLRPLLMRQGRRRFRRQRNLNVAKGRSSHFQCTCLVNSMEERSFNREVSVGGWMQVTVMICHRNAMRCVVL